MSISVLLADDHPVATEAVALSLAEHPGLRVVGQARTVAETNAALERLDPDVLLLDLRFPDGHGTDVLARLRGRDRPAVIVFSAYETPQYVTAAINLGARGFIGKSASVAVILEAIRQVAAGATYYRAEQRRKASQARLPNLTRRELDVLRLLLAGHTNAEIADSLSIATKTVEANLSSIYRKAGGLSRTELVLRAERESWLELL
jgi:DNA-binding NarL/FixJ family response regulator